MVLICPYSEIHKETIRNVESEHCTFSALLKKESPSPRDFIRKVQNLHYPTGKKINGGALLWHLNVVWLFYITLIDSYS